MKPLCNLDSGVHSQVLLRLPDQFDYNRDCFISASVLLCASDTSTRIDSLYRIQFAIRILQCTCKGLRAFIDNLIRTKTVSYQVSSVWHFKWIGPTLAKWLCNLDSGMHSPVTLCLPGQYDYQRDCSISVSVHSRVCEWRLNNITYDIEVTLQFELCSALASDFAPSSPISLKWRLRLYQHQSVLSRMNDIS